jgi:integrase
MAKTRTKANGEGSIFKRKRNGKIKWFAELVVGWKDDGKPNTLPSPQFEKKEEADKWLTDRKSERGKGTLVLPSKLTVAQFLDEWMTKVVAHETKPGTQNTYRWIVGTHLKPSLGAVVLSKLSPTHVQDMLHEKRTVIIGKRKTVLSPRTILHIYTVLHTALNYAVLQALIPINVTDRVKRPKAARAKMNILTPDQGRRFLDVIQDDRFHALYMIAVTLAVRQGELLGLRWMDVNWDKNTISINQTLSELSGRRVFGTPKSGASRRTLDVPPPVMADLKKWRVEQAKERLAIGGGWEHPELVFTTQIGTPYRASHLRTRSLPRLLSDAECPKIKFHELRHTGISMMIGMGLSVKEVQEIAGHADATTTLNIYSHVWQQQKTATAQKIGDFWTAADK